MESSSSSGSSKRAKAASNMNQIVHCLVDGCNADLSLYREYHRRHKVCEIHSKTSKVMIGGHERRFCQQCSRFHSLTEFDEGKRSCRKRLEGHNRRRRKPQRDSLSGNSGMFVCSQEDTRLLSFGSQQILPSAIASSAWAGSVKTENELLLYSSQQHSDYADQQSSFLGCSAQSYQVNQFQFLQGAEATICQPVLDSNPVSGNRSSCPITLSDELNQVFDSDGALSLLSSAPAVTVPSGGIGLNQMVQPAPNHPSSQFSMHYRGLAQYSFNQEMESKPVVSLTDANCRDNANARHNHRVFRDDPDPDGSSSSKSHQTITFRWK